MKYFLLFFIVFAMSACRGHKNEEGVKIKGTLVAGDVRTIPVDVEHPEKVARLSEIIDSLSIVLTPLETTAESVLDVVQHFRVYDGTVYIQCDKQKTIKAFDKSGKYLGELNALGAGPEEYKYLSDFDINKDTLIVLDFNRLLMYNRHSFQFIRSVNLKEKGIGAKYLKYNNNNYYFKCANIEVIKASTVVCDSNLNVVLVLNEPSYHTKLNFASCPYFIPIGNEMYYHQVMNDTIYKITGDGLSAAFIVDAGKHSLGYEKYIRLPVYSEAFPMPIIPKGYIGAIDGFYCADELLSFSVDYDECRYGGLYSLKTNKVRFWRAEGMEDDIMNARTYCFSDASDGEYFYRMIYPSVFLENGNLPKREILARMSEEDNPVLVKYKFREF